MAENKMEAVAQMFGKKLGEEFKLKRRDIINNARFTEDGLEIYDSLFGQWSVFGDVNLELLTGEAVIINE